MKKSLLGVVLCVALLISVIGAALAMPTFAAGEDINMLAVAGPDNDATVTANDDGSLTIVSNGAWNPTTTLANGAFLQPKVVVDAAEMPYIHVSLTSDVPFRMTMFEGTLGAWVVFANEYFNALVPEGAEAPTEAYADEFFPAGTYNCVLNLKGYYDWNYPANVNAANVDTIYVGLQEAGTMTINHMELSASDVCDNGTTDTTESTESTTEATETTTETEATTTTTEVVTTTIPEDAFIVYTIETVEHEGPVAVGEEVEVLVSTGAASDIGGIGLNIAYDNTVLEVVAADVIEGSWLSEADMANTNIMESEVRINCMALSPLASKDGEAIVKLTVKALVEITDGVALNHLSADVVSNSDSGALVNAYCIDGGIKVVEPTTTESTTTTESEADDTTTTESKADDTTTAADATTTASATTTTGANESPKTGDASNALLLVVIAAAAAVVLTASVKKAQAR